MANGQKRQNQKGSSRGPPKPDPPPPPWTPLLALRGFGSATEAPTATATATYPRQSGCIEHHNDGFLTCTEHKLQTVQLQ